MEIEQDKHPIFHEFIDLWETLKESDLMGISQEIGRKIRAFRKARDMTLEELAKRVCKSKSTLSKYEKGDIALDMETFYDIAAALEVHVEQLLYRDPVTKEERDQAGVPAFFKGLNQFYGYIYDGRAGQLLRTVFDVSAPRDGVYPLMMYMNFQTYDRYQACENTYEGTLEHFDALTQISLTNQDTPMEKASCQVLASYLDSPVKWGLFTGFSSRPMMPIAVKLLLSKKILPEDENLIKELKVNREDVRLLKLYNMFSVT